ncbi:hypothetical protein [Stenotrophomonas tumulicola]|uniref:Uncharacterized protein n=1 Tax=Stenotrophomonas tumulicola TaxID=1685415 RepID=A0A7W3IHH5_9GAMM|nr:hypothetical protein [Stenotrophomonas tumulicola]MBA8682058.1 hypothetical protein [Stenotrophomonas tumulicola]
MSSVSTLNPLPVSSSTPLPQQPAQGLRERVDVLLDKLQPPLHEDGETLEEAAAADGTGQAMPPGVGFFRLENPPAAGLSAIVRAQAGWVSAALQPPLAGLHVVQAEGTRVVAAALESRLRGPTPAIRVTGGIQVATPAMKGDANLPSPSPSPQSQSQPLPPLATADAAGNAGQGGQPDVVPGRLPTALHPPGATDVPPQASGLPGVARSPAAPGGPSSASPSKPPVAPGAAMVQRAPVATISKSTTITVPFTAYGPGHQVTAIWTPAAFPGMASQPLLIRSSSEMGHRAVGMAIAAGLTPQGGHWQIEATRETDNGSQQHNGQGGDREDDE